MYILSIVDGFNPFEKYHWPNWSVSPSRGENKRIFETTSYIAISSWNIYHEGFVNGNTLNLHVSPLKSDESMAIAHPNQKGNVFSGKA